MTSVESSSQNQHDTKKKSFFHKHETAQFPDQLLRLRIIDGQFDGLKQSIDTYAIVSIGNQSARTKVVKNSNRPVFEENFAIGYALEDEKSEIVIDFFEKGYASDERIGEFRLRLSQVDPPKNRKSKKEGKERHDPVSAQPETILPDPKHAKQGKRYPAQNAESWSNVQPHKAVFVDRKGHEVGFLNVLLRRETRLQGNLNIQIREIDQSPSNQDFWMTPTHIVAKLGQERFESPVVDPTQGQTRIPFPWDIRFTVNDNNNISDVFFELWQSGIAVAEARLPLYDTRKRYNGSLCFIAPFGGHDVTNTNEKKVVANLILTSEFTNQMLA